MRESDLLSHIHARSRSLSAQFPNVLLGPGDDGALIRIGDDPSPHTLIVTVDHLIEGRHYLAGRTPIDLIARKAIARSVSDIAAMGGSPRWSLATAALPPSFTQADELFDAMHRWAAHFNCPLVGGDVAILPPPSTPTASSPLVLTVTAGGEPHPSRGPVLRSGVQPGDAIFITGRLGGSFGPDGLGRHLTFEPRLSEARSLCDLLGPDLHAMIDVSDGPGRDAARLAEASGVRITLDAALLPLADGTTDSRSALQDGEDYELLFAAPRGTNLPPACPRTGTLITRIGNAELGSGCPVLTPQGLLDGAATGWDHIN
ncbi:MAG: thiamine-monophosphate kinase [Phycisphaerales bacterium]|nr:thiamine-monophosphate kinase [Phycisphaerales bacterium]